MRRSGREAKGHLLASNSWRFLDDHLQDGRRLAASALFLAFAAPLEALFERRFTGILLFWQSSAVFTASPGKQRYSRDFKALAGDEEHDPAEDDGGADEEGKAIEAVAEHAARIFALSDAEDRGSKEREEQHGGEVGGMDHSGFLPVRMLCASTAAMTLSRPATTMNLVP